MTDRTALPDPLVPAEVDLHDYEFMPVLVRRLLDSDFWARSSGDEFKAALALWCKSWSQVPAASLPDDDKVLAHLSGAGAKWRKLRPMALYGWNKCSDGRLYHPLIAEKACEAWESRCRYRKKREVDNKRLKSWRDKADQTEETHDETRFKTHSETRVETDVERVREGEGERQGKREEESSLRSDSPPPPPAPADPPAVHPVENSQSILPDLPPKRSPPGDLKGDDLVAFEAWWDRYPRKVGKGQARPAYAKALPGILAQEPQFQPHASTWLNGERWLDDPPAPAGRSGGPSMNDIVDSVFDDAPPHDGPVIDDLVYVVESDGGAEW